MTEITTANLRKDSVGNLTEVSAEASNIIAGYTWTVPHLRKVVSWGLAPTTEVDYGGAITLGNVITFATGVTIAGRIWARGY